MSAHRYWRVYATASMGGSVVTAAEITMASSIGGSNLCSGGTALSGSNYSGYTAAAAFDGNVSTIWASAGTAPDWIGYDFGAGVTVDIQQVTVTCRNDNSISQSIGAGLIQYSDNGTSWTTYWSFSEPNTNIALGTKFVFINPALWGVTYFDAAVGYGAGSIVSIDNANVGAQINTGSGSARTNKRISGLTYFEMVVGATLTGSWRIGVCNNVFNLQYLLGADPSSNSCGYDTSGSVRINNTVVTTIMSYTTGDNIGVAVDPLKNLIWFRKNGGNWNNDVIGNQNPVGGVGGISLSSIVAPFLPAWGGSTVASATAKFSSSAWSYSAPTGFSAADTMQASGVAHESSVGAAAKYTLPSYLTRVSWPTFEFGYRVYTAGSLISLGAAGSKVSGVTQESGAVVSGRKVYAYDGNNGQFIGTYTSDPSTGAFSIDAMGRTNVFVVALDPTTYQALIFDRVTPV